MPRPRCAGRQACGGGAHAVDMPEQQRAVPGPSQGARTHLIYFFWTKCRLPGLSPRPRAVDPGRQLRSTIALAQGMLRMEEQSAHPATTALCAAPWPLLLSRLGDTLMLYLLLHASIFVSLPNGCYLQASGPPVAQASSLLPAHARTHGSSFQALALEPMCPSCLSVSALAMQRSWTFVDKFVDDRFVAVSELWACICCTSLCQCSGGNSGRHGSPSWYQPRLHSTAG